MRHGTILWSPLRSSPLLMTGASGPKFKKKKLKDVKQTADSTSPSPPIAKKEASTRCSHSHLFASKKEMEQFLLRRMTNPATGSLLSLPYAPHNPTNNEAITLSRKEGGVNVRDDVSMHRRLSIRFTSAVDQEKDYGTSEVTFHTLHDDVTTRLRWARENLRLLIAAPRPRGSAIVVPRRLVVLVLYSHTQHTAAVGRHMRGIRNAVRAMLNECHKEVIGLLTVAVGVKWRDLAPENYAQETGGKAEEEEEILWYPNAGMYTLNALVQCLCRVGLDDGKGGEAIHRKILIVSDGWFHVRTIAEMHQQDNTVVREGDTVDVEPMPFVLGSAHSVGEVEEFARFTACRAVADLH